MCEFDSVTIRCRCIEYVLNLDNDYRVQIFLDYKNPEEEYTDKQRNEALKTTKPTLVIC